MVSGIIKSLLNRDIYQQYGPALLNLKNLEKEETQILHTLGTYFRKYEDKNTISLHDLQIFFTKEFPALPNIETYKSKFRLIENAQLENEQLVEDYLRDVLDLHLTSKLDEKLFKKLQEKDNTPLISILNAATQEYEEVMGVLDKEDENMWDIASIFAVKENESVLKFPLRSLHRDIGFLPPGLLGHIFGRPDSGKSSFSIHSAVNFAWHLEKQDMNEVVLYLINEEAEKRYKARMICCSSGVESAAILGNEKEYFEKWNERGGFRIKIHCVSTLTEVEQFIAKYKPIATFIDQGTKIALNSDHEGPQRLQVLYNNYRELAKRYNTLLLTTGQADVAATGKQRLGLNNIDGSKVGIPGELDLAIGIGYIDSDETLRDTRYFTICKNKLTGIKNMHMMNFDDRRCRFKET